jgi:hypothetical protein
MSQNSSIANMKIIAQSGNDVFDDSGMLNDTNDDGQYSVTASVTSEAIYLSSIYPASFRFIVLIDNAIFLYSPSVGNTSLAILRASVIANPQGEGGMVNMVEKLLGNNSTNTNRANGGEEVDDELVDHIDGGESPDRDYSFIRSDSNVMYDWSDAIDEATQFSESNSLNSGTGAKPPNIGFVHRVDLAKKKKKLESTTTETNQSHTSDFVDEDVRFPSTLSGYHGGGHDRRLSFDSTGTPAVSTNYQFTENVNFSLHQYTKLRKEKINTMTSCSPSSPGFDKYNWSKTIIMNAINDIPHVDEEEISINDDIIEPCNIVLMQKLGLQKILFLITVLLHEEVSSYTVSYFTIIITILYLTCCYYSPYYF